MVRYRCTMCAALCTRSGVAGREKCCDKQRTNPFFPPSLSLCRCGHHDDHDRDHHLTTIERVLHFRHHRALHCHCHSHCHSHSVNAPLQNVEEIPYYYKKGTSKQQRLQLQQQHQKQKLLRLQQQQQQQQHGKVPSLLFWWTWTWQK